jgi:hypothetical protein
MSSTSTTTWTRWLSLFYITTVNRYFNNGFSVADPGCLYPGSWSRIFSIPDPNSYHPGSASKKNLSILTPKIWFLSSLSEIWSGLFIPDPDPRILILMFYPSQDPGSRGQKGHRIPDPDPDVKCLVVWTQGWIRIRVQ